MTEYQKQEDIQNYVYNCFTRGRPVRMSAYDLERQLEDERKKRKKRKRR